MPACGRRSFSSAAVIRLWARVRPSHNLVVSSAAVLAIDVRNRRDSLLRRRGLGRRDDDLGVNRQLDLVARKRHRAGETVPVEPEVHAVQLPGGVDAQPLLATERVGEPALDGAGELDGAGGLLDRELAAELVAVPVELLDAPDLERHGGVLLGVEKVGRAKVRVALVVAGAEACDLYLQDAARLGQVIVGAFELALPPIELAVDGGNRQVLGREADVGVSGIEFVLDHLVLLGIGLLRSILACAINYSQNEGGRTINA